MILLDGYRSHYEGQVLNIIGKLYLIKEALWAKVKTIMKEKKVLLEQ